MVGGGFAIGSDDFGSGRRRVSFFPVGIFLAEGVASFEGERGPRSDEHDECGWCMQLGRVGIEWHHYF